MRQLAYPSAIAACGLALLSAKVGAEPINVVVNGQTINFANSAPQEVGGSVLVPLRGVFEQLGADVEYNPSTRTIFATKGSTKVSLSLGSSTAYVNNQAQQLAQPPAVVMGTTLVPLRFVAESFGAYVEWESQTNTVEIATAGQNPTPIANNPPPPVNPGGPMLRRVEGRIDHIDDPSNPRQLTLNTDSGPVQVQIDERTTISTRTGDTTPIPSAPEALRPGERVVAQLRPDGDARFIEIRSDEHRLSDVHGRVSNIDNLDNPRLITLDTDSGPVQVGLQDGTTIAIGQDTADSHPSGPHGMRLGDEISVQLTPDGNAQTIQINCQEQRGKVITLLSLPNGQSAVVLANGHTLLISKDADCVEHDHVVQHLPHPGDEISARFRSGDKAAYDVEIQ